MKKKIGVLLLAAVMMLSAIACGKKDTEQKEGEANVDPASEYVYVPEFFKMERDANDWFNGITLQGDKIYYSVQGFDEEAGTMTNKFAYRSLNDLSTENAMDLYFGIENFEESLNICCPDAEGNLYAIWNCYEPWVEGMEYYDMKNVDYLVKYDSTGKELWANELSKDAFGDSENTYIQKMMVSSDGKIVASTGSHFIIFNSDGSLFKTVPTGSDWVDSMCLTDAGKLLFTAYGMNGMEMCEIDLATGAKGNTYKNIPDMNGRMEYINGKLYMSGYTKLYEYDLEKQEAVEILSWLDSSVEGNYVQAFTVTEEGKVVVYVDNYSTGAEIAVLTKKPASEVPQKQIITLATLYDGTNLTEAIVNFNKTNTQYQIKLKTYIDSTAEWTETTYEDGLARMNADLISDNAPDIIDLTYVDVPSLVAKGALEDLTPYLEKSTIANKSEFVPSVLNAYNYDGVQVTVPASFNIITLMGKASNVGTEPGWTMDEVIALAEKNPDAQLLRYMTKAQALQLCIQYNNDSFIDYATGTCKFNTPEFIKVLEFANEFPDEYNYDDDRSFPAMIQSGQVLLADVYLYDVTEYQMHRLMFEDEVTAIGYPTSDGTPGVFLSGQDMCGISASSDCKEGAWAFVESTLAKQDNIHGYWMFPSRKDELDALFEEAMKIDYMYDANGNIMYDEDGNAMQYPKTSWGYDDWEADIYAATQEEVDEIKAMIEMARPMNGADQTVFNIILEEAGPYFKGQKSAQDVANIIQSRVDMYISENY